MGESRRATHYKGVYGCIKAPLPKGHIEFHGKKHARKSYADLAGECAKKGMRLPTWSELCPKGKGSTPTGGKTADADMWTPIVGQSNGNKWVQIGGRHGGTCNPLSTYHGSRGHWMESRRATHYKGVYGCIKAPLPKGHIEFHGKKHARKSYADLAGECAKKGVRLPTWSELCPKGKGSPPTGGKTADADMWTPIVGQSNGNKWVQIGGRHGGTCNPLST